MYEYLLHSVNIFFFVFHSVLVLFNMFGWLRPRWRLMNFITLSLTAFSWFIIGIWHGWGYCFCTDWHWKIRELLGYHDMSNSYIHFLVLKFTGINFPVNLVDTSTVIVFFCSFAISIYLNIKNWRTRLLKQNKF